MDHNHTAPKISLLRSCKAVSYNDTASEQQFDQVCKLQTVITPLIKNIRKNRGLH